MILMESSRPHPTEAQQIVQRCIDFMSKNSQSHAVWAALVFGNLAIGSNPAIVFEGPSGGSIDLALDTLNKVNQIHIGAGCDMGYNHTKYPYFL